MAEIQKIVQDKILVLDGAMGTMIQQYNFSEEDYRGEQFKDFHISVNIFHIEILYIVCKDQ